MTERNQFGMPQIILRSLRYRQRVFKNVSINSSTMGYKMTRKALRMFVTTVLSLASITTMSVAVACTCGVDCPASCVTEGGSPALPADAGWRCSWDKSDVTGYSPFPAQMTTTSEKSDQILHMTVLPGVVVDLPLWVSVPAWMWTSEVWRFSNSLHYDSYTAYPAGDRAVAWALDAALTTEQESRERNPNFWLHNHFRGKDSPVFSVDNQLTDINQLTGIVKSVDDPDGIGSIDQLYNGLCQKAGMYLSCASSRIPWYGGKGGACYRSSASSVFTTVSPLNDIAMRMMEGAVFILVTQNAKYVSAKSAYTYGGETHVYFVKKMQNTMGATHSSDLTDINNELSDHIYNLYNADMTWNFYVIDPVNGKGAWTTIYNHTMRFMWSTGSVSKRNFSLLQRDDGSWEMIHGYVAYDPIDSRAF
jgi:hypothetical protein